MIEVKDILTYEGGDSWRDIAYDEIFNKNEYVYENIFVEKGDIVIDAGGNIGIFSLYAQEMGAKFIYAFEPIPKYISIFKKNLENFNNVKLIESALSNITKRSDIQFGSDDNSMLVDVWNGHHWDLPSDKEKIEIDILSINDFLDSLERVDFLKIDIEGSEYFVLDSITPENYKKIRKIACEYHWNYDNRLDNSLRILNENNFTVHNFITNDYCKIGKLFAIQK